MPKIELETTIQSTIEICFDLSRSIDLHQISTEKTNEKAIAGTTTGLINLGEFVTWEATHLGVRQKLSSRITALEKPFHFRDEQISGAFKSIVHDHFFESRNDTVIMKDIFVYQSPMGILGKFFNTVFLTNYLKKLLLKRNSIIKEYAETEKWKMVLRKQ